MKVLCLVTVLCSSGLTFAVDPEEELGSGRYIAHPITVDGYVRPGVDLSVGNFSPRIHSDVSGIADQINFECSPARGLVSTSDYAGFSGYIRSAFIKQLQNADRFQAESPIQLSGELRKVELNFDSIDGESLSRGVWSIQLVLRSSLGREELFLANHSYPIRDLDSYCHEMADQFMSSVQSLMIEIFESEKFGTLVNPTGITLR